MQSIRAVHVLCGIAGLFAGYVALYAAKGAPAHRRSGILFVSVMLTLSVTGLFLAAARGVAPAINFATAAVTFYMVVTGFMTVRPHSPLHRRIDRSATVMAFAIALACAAIAVSYFAEPGGTMPALFMSIFGTVAAAAGVGDVRVLRAGPPKGAARLKRHLWRMCFALFVASLGFFLPPNRLPVALRIPALRIAAVLLPVVAIGYWMFRLRGRRVRSLDVELADRPHLNAAFARRGNTGGYL